MNIDDILDLELDEPFLRSSKSKNTTQNKKLENILSENDFKANAFSEIFDSANLHEVKEPTKKAFQLFEKKLYHGNDNGDDGDVGDVQDKEQKKSSNLEIGQSKNFESDETDIPYIREIQDIESEQLNASLETSNIMIKYMINLQDLEKDISKPLPFTIMDGIDFSALTKQLIPYNQVKEEDKAWTWDNLISDVGSSWSKISNSEPFISELNKKIDH